MPDAVELLGPTKPQGKKSAKGVAELGGPGLRQGLANCFDIHQVVLHISPELNRRGTNGWPLWVPVT